MSLFAALVGRTAWFLSSYSIVLILFIDSATYVDASVDEQKYWAGLEGEFEKPKVDTSASGMAVFKSTKDSMWYLVNVTGIDKVTSAHIHNGEIGENGPVIALRCSANDTVTGDINGTLTQGNVTGDMLKVSSGATQLLELALAMKNGTAYVDLHTVDYPDGEIRGQIMSANSTHAELMMS